MKLVYNNRAFEILRSMRSSVEPSTLPFVQIQRSQSQIDEEEEEREREKKKSSNNYGYTIHIFGLTYTHRHTLIYTIRHFYIYHSVYELCIVCVCILLNVYMRVFRSFFGSLLLVWLFKSFKFIYIHTFFSRQSAIFFFSFHFIFSFFLCIISSSFSFLTHCWKHWLYIHSCFKYSHTDIHM